MRYPEGHKEQVRERIVLRAAQALRKSGLSGVSIPALMKKAGLTHGGFYAHFRDRDELVAAAVDVAADQTGAAVFESSPDLKTVLERYLSETHVAHPEQGCVLAALGTDGPRQSAVVRRAFDRAVRGMFQLVDAKRRPERPKPATAPSDEAITLACRMVGAVVLARLVDDHALAARILRVARHLDP
ncbi:TetR/AcrR family transcriptional regulator [Myxococcota bacterium]|nr:TetR/AcrR family transcriptional regulator [Myxococcota bacterium]